MKKSKILNIMLTSVMLLSTILTPQMSYALASMQDEGAEEITEVEQTDTDEEENEEENVGEEPADDEDDNSDEGNGSAEVTHVDGETESKEPEDEPQPVEEDETKDDKQENPDNNSPPAATPATLNIGPTAAVDLGNIFTNPQLTVNEENIQDGAIINIDEGTIVQLDYEWHTEELDAAAGDTASIQLPDNFKQVNIQNQPVTVGEITVGTYSIIDGKLTLTFDDNIEDGDVSNGVIGLNLNFDMEKFKENIEQVISFNDQDETTLKVTARPTGDISRIIKEGRPDRDENAREITWSIDVMNDNDEPISDAVLTDVLPEGLGNPRDFVIKELSVGINGNKIEGPVAENITPEVDGNEFSINFESLAPFTGYRVKYTTTIEDYTIDSFTNNAEFSYEDTDLPAEATVDGFKRSNPIQKEGKYNWTTGQIDWTIIVNENGMEIDNAIVHDKLPEEQTLVGSIKVTKNWQEVENEETDFPIKLGTIAADEVYRIHFSTNIDWTKVNGGEYQHHNEFFNGTELRDGEKLVGKDDAKVDHRRRSLIEKSGDTEDYNYEDKVLSWKIEVNKAKHPINNAVLTDILPAGLETITFEDITIEGAEVDSKDVTITKNGDGTQTIVINLGNIDEQVTITYNTEVKDFEENNFKNEASLGGEGIGIETPEDEKTINPPGNAFSKDFRGIDYNEKTMGWRISVNPQREAITELIIEDTFPNNGMILLPESIIVKIGETELVKGTDYTLEPNTDIEDNETGYHKGFTIELININKDNPLNAVLTVDFKTSYDPQKVVDEKTLDPHVDIGKDHSEELVYINNANFTGKTVNDNNFGRNDNAETSIIGESWNSGKKEGKLVREDKDKNLVSGWASGSERKIAWQLYTNYQKQNLGTDVVITDTLEYEGIINPESITVSKYSVKPNGDTEITGPELNPDNYDVVVYVNDEGYSEFTLKFDGEIEVEERYVVQYTTTVPNISQPNYTNDATVRVSENEYPYSGTVNYEEHNAFLEKGTVGVDGNQVYTGDEIEWQVTVNESLSIIENAVITDTISDGLVYVEDSLRISTKSGINLVEDDDYILDSPATEDGTTVLTIALNEALTETLVLNYTTVVTETEGQVNNAIDLAGEDITVDTVTTQGLNAREFSWVGGNFLPNRGAIRLEKFDAEEEVLIENNEATFELWYDLNDKRIQYTQADGNGETIPFTTEKGVLEIGNLPIRTYYLTEVKAPEGYEVSDEEIEITVESFGNNENYSELEFENIKEKIDVTGTKAWDNGPKPSIELQLFRDNEAVDDPVTLNGTEDEPWTYTWAGLDKTDIDGKEYIYTVDEVNVPENYNKNISDDGLTITNEFESPLIDIPVEKRWEDSSNQDDVRPDSIEVELLAGGNATDYDNLTLSSASDWKGIFTDLPELDIDGNRIEYSVDEVDFDGGYESEITGNVEDGFIVINSREPEQIEISGEKIWKDDNDRDRVRPNSITVNLLADGTPKKSINVTKDDNWAYKFESLDKFKDGNEIVYTITENTVEGYTQDIEDVEDVNYNDYNITNNYTPKETGVTVTKAWVDESNQDDLRPESIKVQLTANGDNVGEIQELSAEDNWTYTWIGLPLNDNGIAINYSVEEVSDPGKYTAEINDDDHGNIIITNKYTPEVTEVSITKEWNDEDNLAGFRPSHIEVELYADGAATGKIINIVADEEGVWEGSFINLPKYRDEGEQIEYSIQEVNIDKDLYSLEMNSGEEDENGFVYDFTLINTHEVERMNLEGTKTWNDAENQDGVRPESITVRLLANGEEVADIEVTEATDWTFEFASLPKFADGEVINYTIQEDKVEEYSTEIDGMDITNSYTPGQTSINVVKAWDDVQDKDGIRPESITVKLFADGKDTGQELVLSAENNWQGDFTELDEYSNGELIVYTIEEVAVEGYETIITGTSENGFVITNTHRPEDPEEPGKPGEEKPGGNDIEDPADSDKGSNLPKSGEAASYTLLALVLVGLGLGLRFYGKRRTN